MDKVLSKIIQDVAAKHNVPQEQVELIYMNMFKFIRDKLTAVDFDLVETEEDLRAMKVNFNIPRVFKLYTTKDRINYAREAIRKSNPQHGEGINADNDAESAEGEQFKPDPS